MDRSEKRVCGCVGLVILFISCFLIGYSFRVVHHTEFGLVQAEISDAIVEPPKAGSYGPGRHYTGLGFVFLHFPGSLQEVDFTVPAGTSAATYKVGSMTSKMNGPVTVRTKDGQIIDLEVSFQYRLNPEKALSILHNFGHPETADESKGWHHFFTNHARSTLRDVAAQRGFEEFWANRTDIEREMKAKVSDSLRCGGGCSTSAMKNDKVGFASLADLQLRGLFPQKSLVDAIEDITMHDILIKKKGAEIEITKIEGQTNKEVAEKVEERKGNASVYTVETNNNVTKVKQLTAIEKEKTEMAVQTLQAAIEKDIAVFNQKSKNLYAGKTQDLKNVTAETKRKVAVVRGEQTVVEATLAKDVAAKVADAGAYEVRVLADATAARIDALANATASGHVFSHAIDRSSFFVHPPHYLWVPLFIQCDRWVLTIEMVLIFPFLSLRYETLADAGWSAQQLNALKFAEVIRARVGADNLGSLLAKMKGGTAAGSDGAGMVLDLHQPKALLLTGQAEGYEKDREAAVPNAL